MMSRPTMFIAIAFAANLISACARAPEATPGMQGTSNVISTVAIPATSARPESNASASLSLPLVIVHKTESCGCCGAWVKHMQQAGFPVKVRNLDDVTPVKQRVGVPLGKGSCHTAEVGGYFVEGHVPANDIKRLLAEKPVAKGLVLPGMPAGSPGMETPDGRVQPYVVELVGEDGKTVAFAQHGQ